MLSWMFWGSGTTVTAVALGADSARQYSLAGSGCINVDI